MGAEVIVKLGNWTNNPKVVAFCDNLLALTGTEKRSKPQRCEILKDRKLLASIGFEGKTPVIEFIPDKGSYAEAHGARFIKPHPLQQMARDGWLQGRPESDEQLGLIINWIKAGAVEAAASIAKQTMQRK